MHSAMLVCNGEIKLKEPGKPENYTDKIQTQNGVMITVSEVQTGFIMAMKIKYASSREAMSMISVICMMMLFRQSNSGDVEVLAMSHTDFYNFEVSLQAETKRSTFTCRYGKTKICSRLLITVLQN